MAKTPATKKKAKRRLLEEERVKLWEARKIGAQAKYAERVPEHLNQEVEESLSVNERDGQ